MDKTFKAFLEKLQSEVSEPIELILNGDIFDFDSVMRIPENPTFKVSWIERMRGLAAEEDKSQFKTRMILNDHYIWVNTVRDFILAGNRVVFVIGNHDVELHWPKVQAEILDHLKLPEQMQENVRFCSWFYISNEDTLIEHGNQYDHYCLCSDPVHPMIRKGKRTTVRLPFGNIAGKYILNGMGLMNPHVDSSFIKSSIWEYIVFFYRYQVRSQPLILFSWLWGAGVTAVRSLQEGLSAPIRDPLTVESRVDEIAKYANTTPRTVRSLRALHVHPAVFNPFRILRELWLDRFLFLMFLFFFCFWFFSTLNVFVEVSVWWFVVPFFVLLPVFVFYARSVVSENGQVHKAMKKIIPMASQIANVKRIVYGHTHYEMHIDVQGVEVLNTGTWSAAYHDPECTKPFGRKCFAWIRPDGSGKRISELYEWKEDEFHKLPQRLRSSKKFKKSK